MKGRHLLPIVGYLRDLMNAGPESADSDGQLLHRFITHREEAAFTTLVQRHGPLVWGVCRRVLRDVSQAEDSFQATFLVLVRKAASIVKRDSLRSWLYSVAFSIAQRARARAERQASRERSIEGPVAAAPTDAEAWQQLQPVLDEELSRLPEKFRAPLLLCYLEGKTRDEAAQELGWSAGTVKGRLERGRELLRGRLARRGLVMPAALLPALVAQGATVPAALLSVTVKAAVGGAVAARVSHLVKGALQAMFWTKVKMCTFTLALGLIALGIALPLYQAYASKPAAEDRAAVPEQKTENLPEDLRGQRVLVDCRFYSPNPPGKEQTAKAEEVRSALQKANVRLVKILSEKEESTACWTYMAMLLLDCKGQLPSKALADMPSYCPGGIVFQDGNYQEGLPLGEKAKTPAPWGYAGWSAPERSIGGKFDRDVARFEKIPGLKLKYLDTNDGTPGSYISAQLTAEAGKKTLLEIFVLTEASFEYVDAKTVNRKSSQPALKE